MRKEELVLVDKFTWLVFEFIDITRAWVSCNIYEIRIRISKYVSAAFAVWMPDWTSVDQWTFKLKQTQIETQRLIPADPFESTQCWSLLDFRHRFRFLICPSWGNFKGRHKVQTRSVQHTVSDTAGLEVQTRTRKINCRSCFSNLRLRGVTGK